MMTSGGGCGSDVEGTAGELFLRSQERFVVCTCRLEYDVTVLENLVMYHVRCC